MKLTEKQAFQITNHFLSYFGIDDSTITKEEVSDYVMIELINLEVEE